MTNPRKPLAFGYCRVSTARQAAQGVSLESQENDINAYFRFALQDKYGWGGIFTDDVSGKVPLRQRPAGADLFGILEDGDCILFSKLDRAFRSLIDMLETLRMLDARGIRLVFRDLNCDTDTDIGKLILQVFGAFAEFERARIAERVREGKSIRRAQGAYMGGWVPYGFVVKKNHKGKNVLVPYPEERAIGSKIVEWKQAGWAWDTITMHLLKHRITNKTGKEYSRSTVQNHYWYELRAREAEAEAKQIEEELPS